MKIVRPQSQASRDFFTSLPAILPETNRTTVKQSGEKHILVGSSFPGCPRTRKAGISIIEILIVIAILVLLTALLLPVYHRAKSASYPAVSTSNLRQIYVAWSNYRSDHDDMWPPSFKPVADTISDKRILVSPGDPFEEGANPYLSERLKTRVSYFYNSLFPEDRAKMLEMDPNHGVLVDLTFGEVVDPTAPAELRYRGLTLRLRLDGSVHRDQVNFLCSRGGAGVIKGKPNWIMMTDARPCRTRECEEGKFVDCR